MKIMVALPTDRVDRVDEFIAGKAVGEMSAHVEALGIDAVFVTDHPAPDDRWLKHGGHHALEPTVALSFAAAATSTLRLVTNIYVLAYRNPLLAAKSLSSLDVMSGGRLTVGVAAGYLRSEFDAVGADFENRGAVLDESLDTVIQAWTGESVVASAQRWSARGNTQLPRPTQLPNPPIWCGGNSLAAMRRAVEVCDGWMPFTTPPNVAAAARTAEINSVADLGIRLGRLDELCIEHGRLQDGAPDRPTICFTPPHAWPDVAGLQHDAAELAEIGVDWLALTIPATPGVGETRQEWMRSIEGLAGALCG